MKYLIACLGNIGPEYGDTRHNIGFMIADAFVASMDVKFSTERYAHIAQTSLKNKQIFVIKPTTYMNLSGKAVNYWIQQLKVPLENVLVVLDDLALPFGDVKMKPKGSDAGHNGLKNINLVLGTSDYARLRFGIGNNYLKGQQANYVLSGFDDDEIPQLPELISKSVEMIKSFALAGTELTMTKYN